MAKGKNLGRSYFTQNYSFSTQQLAAGKEYFLIFFRWHNKVKIDIKKTQKYISKENKN